MQKRLNIKGFAFLLGSIFFEVHIHDAVGQENNVLSTDKEYITLGEIFSMLPHTDARDKIQILEAPAYGQHIILDKQKLLNIHKKYKLGRSIPIPWTFKILRKGRLLKQEEIEYQREARHKGKTKWSFFGLFNLAFDGLTSFSILQSPSPWREGTGMAANRDAAEAPAKATVLTVMSCLRTGRKN